MILIFVFLPILLIYFFLLVSSIHGLGLESYYIFLMVGRGGPNERDKLKSFVPLPHVFFLSFAPSFISYLTFTSYLYSKARFHNFFSVLLRLQFFKILVPRHESINLFLSLKLKLQLYFSSNFFRNSCLKARIFKFSTGFPCT